MADTQKQTVDPEEFRYQLAQLVETEEFRQTYADTVAALLQDPGFLAWSDAKYASRIADARKELAAWYRRYWRLDEKLALLLAANHKFPYQLLEMSREALLAITGITPVQVQTIRRYRSSNGLHQLDMYLLVDLLK